jgi:predicted nucleic acid-binding protein
MHQLCDSAFLFVWEPAESYNNSMVGTPDTTVRIYADTSVFGGVFDEEFEGPSKAFFDAIRKARFLLVTSELVRQEIQAGPKSAQKLFFDILPLVDIADITAEAIKLQKAYTDAGILSEKYSTDALHVALATVSLSSLIVSWNFRHIVHFQKIPMYNAVNKLNSYSEIAIYSPLEVIEYED